MNQGVIVWCLICVNLLHKSVSGTAFSSRYSYNDVSDRNSCEESRNHGFKFWPKRQVSRIGTVSIIGDVNDVLNGRVTSLTERINWPAQDIVGFGAGSIGPMSGMGETMMVNGYAFVRQTDNSTKNYFQTIYGPSYRSPFAMFVPRGLKADGVASFSPRRPGDTISFTELYTEMYQSTNGSPFCFYGLTQFGQMEAIAISKAPIYSEPLFGDLANGYYTQPAFRIPDAYGFTFGCAANFSTIADPNLRRKLNRALYVNPLDAGSGSALQVHSHVLTGKDCVNNINQITPNTALDVYHLVSNSSIRFINARVFKIDSNFKLSELGANF